MKSTLSNVFIFAAGAAIGSAVTWKILKTKYEKLAKEEIESVKEVFSRRREVESEDVEDVENLDDEDCDGVNEELKKAVDEIAHSEGYTNYSDLMNNKKTSGVRKPVNENKKKPYVIPPNEFDELDGYEAISLTYFEDGVLTDDQYVPVEDVEGTVGRDNLDTFGDYEDDSVFVRNEELRTDFEILADMRKYSDVVGNNPHRAEES